MDPEATRAEMEAKAADAAERIENLVAGFLHGVGATPHEAELRNLRKVAENIVRGIFGLPLRPMNLDVPPGKDRKLWMEAVYRRLHEALDWTPDARRPDPGPGGEQWVGIHGTLEETTGDPEPHMTQAPPRWEHDAICAKNEAGIADVIERLDAGWEVLRADPGGAFLVYIIRRPKPQDQAPA